MNTTASEKNLTIYINFADAQALWPREIVAYAHRESCI